MRHPKPIPKIGPGTPIKTAMETIPILNTFNAGNYLKVSIKLSSLFLAVFDTVNTKNIPTTITQYITIMMRVFGVAYYSMKVLSTTSLNFLFYSSSSTTSSLNTINFSSNFGSSD